MLGANLYDGSEIHGQNNISHPTRPGIVVNKDCDELLKSPIRRVFYLSAEPSSAGVRHQVTREAHPRVLEKLNDSDAIIFGCGSLFTSICPCLCVGGISEAIAKDQSRPRILMLNGSHDRETASMTVEDVVLAIVSALNQGRTDGLELPASSYISVLIVPKGGDFSLDEKRLYSLGIQRIVEVDSVKDSKGRVVYEVTSVINALQIYANQTMAGHREK